MNLELVPLLVSFLYGYLLLSNLYLKLSTSFSFVISCKFIIILVVWNNNRVALRIFKIRLAHFLTYNLLFIPCSFGRKIRLWRPFLFFLSQEFRRIVSKFSFLRCAYLTSMLLQLPFDLAEMGDDHYIFIIGLWAVLLQIIRVRI
jgi:hypothetical protein